MTDRIVDMRLTPVAVPLIAPLRFSWGAHPFVQRIIVELETDDGLIGIGECYGDEVRMAALERARRYVIGRSPYELEPLRWLISPPGLVKLFQGSIALHVYASVEFACLDLIGQMTGRPLSDLLGGRLRDRIDVAGYLFYQYPDQAGEAEIVDAGALVEKAKSMVASDGYRSLKLKAGVLSPGAEVETFLAVRGAFPGLALRIDPNGIWSIATSISVARQLRDANVEYLEDPTWSMRAMRRVAELAPWVPLASNQAVFGFEDLQYNVSESAIDVVLADVHWYGGARATAMLARTCEAFGLDLGMHSGTELGISQAVQLHVASVTPGLGSAFAVDSHYMHLRDDIIEGPMLDISDGAMQVPDGPGIGVSLDRDKLEQYREEHERRGGFTVWTEDPFAEEHLPTIPKY